jgi:hypothetical protein
MSSTSCSVKPRLPDSSRLTFWETSGDGLGFLEFSMTFAWRRQP